MSNVFLSRVPLVLIVVGSFGFDFGHWTLDVGLRHMNPFRKHSGRVALLDRANVDTDQIIPKQFLKRIERTGFGEFLFYDWRYLPSGELNASFALNESRYRDASILVTGKNFGCGSSREHAPWALADFGFRAIIAASFADIFANNCLKNGLLPVVLSETEVAELGRRARELDDYQVTVDLEERKVTDALGFAAAFAIDEFQRQCLLQGLDDIDLTLQHEPAISAYENQQRPYAHR
jgi:3-isopropylmalate/(R)-2-methylmalate dehydratase small subunit